MSEQPSHPPFSRRACSPFSNVNRRSIGERARRLTGMLALMIFLLLTACADNDPDRFLVHSEHTRFGVLDDPSNVTTASAAPVIASGKWNGPTTEQSNAVPSTQPTLELTIQQAVLMALDRNRDLVVQRFNPQITEFTEQGLYGQFDPLLTGTASAQRTWHGPGQFDSKSIQGQAAIQQFFPTGTTVNAGVTYSDGGTHLYGDGRDAVTAVRGGVTVTQALLQGANVRVNLASIRQAQLDVVTSQYELRGFIETLAGNTETAYINFTLDRRVLDIAESALNVAQEQLDETDAMIASGRSAKSDRAAALATLEQRREDRINAKSSLEVARLQLLRFVNGPSADLAGGWRSQVKIVQPAVPVTALDDVDAHVRVARLYRADLNQARLQTERGTLSVVRTRDGLLPQLNLFATFGRTWYFHTPVSNTGGAATNGNTVTTIGGTVVFSPNYANGGSYDAEVGLNLTYPILNRTAEAAFRSAIASRDQADRAVFNLEQQVDLDVRTAYEQAQRSQEQIAAATATLSARQAALDVERGRYRVGKSTSLLVSVAEQDVLNSQIDQATAVASYLNGLVALYVAEGSLLERRGLSTTAVAVAH